VWWIATALGGSDALSLATDLVETVGPRPAGSPAVARGMDWVEDRLEERGWEPTRWSGVRSGGVLACKPGRTERTLLFFAHIDSVHSDCPGANDNAAAVGALLELAGRLETGPRTVCLAFPDGEELGLLGSFQLRDLGRLENIDQVVALDLVGRGTVTHNGLGPPFSAADARELLRAAPAEVPWVYRALSHGAPQLERSDHLPWTRVGVPSSHLMSRAESGVFWAYHTAADSPGQLEPDTMEAVVQTLLGITRMEPLERGSGSPWFVIPFTTIVLPGWVTWLGIGLGGFLGLGTARRRAEPTPWGAVLGGTSAGVLAIGVASGGRPFGETLALPVVLSMWAAWGAVLVGIGGRRGPWLLRIAAVLGLLATGALLWLGLPLLALPAAVALGGVGLGALSEDLRVRSPMGSRGVWGVAAVMAAWPALYLLRPAPVRELAFHHLLGASWTVWGPMFAVLTLGLGSVLAMRVRRRLGAAGVLVLIAFGSSLWAWSLPVRSGVYERPDALRPEVQRSAPLPEEPDAIP